ncbi:SDR family NAD(P)-dependent oxidoreductase [Pseudofrankia sp. BMG5.37]|uniref:SDR family oxidoreductase n=2 Tax=unclassified Pseudofrankia TaxID=2994372 RepID=UPI0008DA1081|nr:MULTISPECIES: SDR family NAD(P)-dependent oxidoreductase [unclassified Pseudofrankia]MDT3438141.1 SDR family NAD(P)-dependent oxidoreductase [Pseudofrankia sp. BMG5.37]OHV56891.1 short-chain dehydrogenase [Pseudofrankia sp. BMG5.36]
MTGGPPPLVPGLAGRGALVTGASSGIGRAISLRLARDGVRVLATGRNEQALESLAKEADGAGLTLDHFPADLTDADEQTGLLDAVHGSLGAVSVLVHSAGAYRRGQVAQARVTDLDLQFAVNVQAPYALTQRLIPDLVCTSGDVVFVNSTQGLAASAGVGQYAATKHALRAMADSLRAEMSSSGVRVCSIYPGRTATPMQEKIFQAEYRAWRPDCLLRPDDLADIVAHTLALPARAQVTELTVWPTQRS